MRYRKNAAGCVAIWLLAMIIGSAGAQAADLLEPLKGNDLKKAWRTPLGDWTLGTETCINPNDATLLSWKKGQGELLNGAKGKTCNILTKFEHGDVELHIEFMVPNSSNSGVYFQGRYEIQVFDSWGVKKPQHSDCGGIYQRWKNGKGYEGFPPRVNASKQPGQWQSYDVIFRAPRFDSKGNKVEDAIFIKVVHNGKVIHENQAVSGPTRSSTFNDEKPLGPLMLQGDHRAVVYRNIQIRPLQKDPLREANAKTFQKIVFYEFGQSRADFALIEKNIRETDDPSDLAEIEYNLLEALETPAATFACKQYVCRILRRIGTERAVPALAKLLEDEKLSHLARFALQNMSTPKAGEALRGALSKVEGDLKIGIIGSLGQRGDCLAVEPLAQLIKRRNYLAFSLVRNKDVKESRAVLKALGQIGCGHAYEALKKAKVLDELEDLRVDSILKCADKMLETDSYPIRSVSTYKKYSRKRQTFLVGKPIPALTRIAAYRGLIKGRGRTAVPLVVKMLSDPNIELQRAGAKFIKEMGTDGITTLKLADALGDLQPSAQRLLIAAFAERGDALAAKSVAALVKSEDMSVRLAAIQALGALGDDSHVALLASFISEGGVTESAAKAALLRLRGWGVGRELLRIARYDSEPGRRIAAIEAIDKRREKSVESALIKLASDKDPKIRQAAQKSIGTLGSASEMPEMIALLSRTEDATERRNIERALASMADGEREASSWLLIESLSSASDEAKVSLLTVLGKVGGAEALETLCIKAKSKNPEICQASVRALAAWPTPAPLPDLLSAAESTNDSTAALLALRGAIRLAGLGSERSALESIKIYRSALNLAKRSEEKKLALKGLASLGHADALKLAKTFVSDNSVRNEAEMAVDEISKQLGISTPLLSRTELKAKAGKIHGSGAAYESASNRDCIGNWTSADAWVSWSVNIGEPGAYSVEVMQSMAGSAGSTYEVLVGSQNLSGVVRETGDWAKFVPVNLGTVKLSKAGRCEVSFRPTNKSGSFVVNLRSVILRRME